jgi:two-component system, sensor histidine kinase and response regulator
MIEILIIDDQESIIDMLKRRLGKFDYTIYYCLNVADAKKFLELKKVDLLLIDYMMPEVSGFDFFVSFENKEEIPVIMMTAHPSINLATEFIKQGGTDFIEKPIDIDILHVKIQRAVYNSQKINYEKTQRIKAEEELKKSYEALKINAQQLELANSQLESFAGIVAHDLRTPISGQKMLVEYLIGEAQSFENPLLDKACIESLNTLHENADEMLLLVNTLLEFSKLKIDGINFKPIDTKALVIDIAKKYSDNPKVHIKIGPLHPIKAEPTLIKQVFSNLIQNAIKYSATKEKQIIVINSEVKDNLVTFSIKDNGIGFKMENANRIFAMFSRLETDEEFEGTGIGLAIVKNILSRHGGKIWVTSMPDEGSCFYFSIPIIK